MNQRRAALAAIAVVIPLAMLATLYTGSPAQQAGEKREKIVVVASFYPLYEFASRVGGDRAQVLSLVPAGIEPHDWEPSPMDASRMRSADFLVINGAGFESWAGDLETKVVDTSEGIEARNPHIWLDPILAKHQVEKIRQGFVDADPENASYYDQNAAAFSAKLDQLDTFVKQELGDCEKSDFIAFHDAFAHFADRYGLTQHGIHGASPEGEILPQKMQEVVKLADDLGISVIYSEDLIDGTPAKTLAGEIPGGRVLVLSPIEGIGSKEQALGIGYIDKMKENVANLKVGLQCR
jgi:zinc transport system substrate-binding protein